MSVPREVGETSPELGLEGAADLHYERGYRQGFTPEAGWAWMNAQT
jgi:hypothetical protein